MEAAKNVPQRNAIGALKKLRLSLSGTKSEYLLLPFNDHPKVSSL